jgi:hypothetical protein
MANHMISLITSSTTDPELTNSIMITLYNRHTHYRSIGGIVRGDVIELQHLPEHSLSHPIKKKLIYRYYQHYQYYFVFFVSDWLYVYHGENKLHVDDIMMLLMMMMSHMYYPNILSWIFIVLSLETNVYWHYVTLVWHISPSPSLCCPFSLLLTNTILLFFV